MDVPGALKDDLEIAPGPVRGSLSVRLKGREARPQDGRLLVQERPVDAGAVRYTRILPVAWDADVSKAESSLVDGVLTITIPREQPSTTTRGAEKKRKS